MKKILLFALGALLACLGLTGCFSGYGSLYSTGGTVQNRSFGSGDTVLTIHALNMEYVQHFVETAFERFRQQHPDVRVELKGINFSQEDPAAMDRELEALLAGGGAGDIVLTDYVLANAYAAEGYFANLYPYLDEADGISRDSFYPNMLKAWETNGELMFFSPMVSYNVVMVNSEHKHLIEDELAEMDSLGYEDMAALYALALERDEGQAALYPAEAYYARYVLDMERNVIYNEKTGLVRAAELAGNVLKTVEPISSGDVLLAPEKSEGIESSQYLFTIGYTPSVTALFPETASAMAVSGYYPYRDMEGNFKFNGFGTSFAVTESSENKALAFAFLQCMTLEVNRQASYTYRDFLPSRRDELGGSYREYVQGLVVGNGSAKVSQETFDERLARVENHQARLNVYEPFNAYYSELLTEVFGRYEAGELGADALAGVLQQQLEQLMAEENS